MTHRIDSSLAKELAAYGAETVNKCFNCGNCSAVCSEAHTGNYFPRRQVRYLQLGLKQRLVETPDPWLCYYCGDCSDTCPREAQPAEMMMAMRRWLTTRYDWTGLSRKLYLSKAWEIGSLLVIALIILLLFTVPSGFGFRLLNLSLFQHPEALTSVQLQYFAPSHIVHRGDWILAGLLTFFLLSNAARMMAFTLRGERIPLTLFVTKLPELVLHFGTQKRWGDCEKDTRKDWWRHIALVLGYAIMFTLVVVFLNQFQVNDKGWHWTSWLGYYSTAALLVITSWAMLDRLQKKDQIHKYSHLSDWLFLILLFFTALSGILLHIFRRLDMAMATYVMYMMHMIIAVPMLVVEVPFGKWSHLVYRPMAAYLVAVKEAAAAVRTRVSALRVPAV